MPTLQRNNQHSKGVLCILLSAFSFACMNFFVRFAGAMPFFEKVLFRNAVSLAIAGGTVLRTRATWPKDGATWGILLLRSACGTIGLFASFYALDHMVLGDASMLGELAPFATILFSFLFLRESITWKQLLLVVGAFLGCLFIVKPTGHGGDVAPYVIGVVGGIASGGAYTCVRALGKRGVAGPEVVLVFSAFSSLVILPFFIVYAVPITLGQFLCLMMVGLCATVGQFAVTAAYSFAPGREISIYEYSNVAFSALLGFLFLGQIPDRWSLAGYAIIFTMALLMFLSNKRQEPHP